MSRFASILELPPQHRKQAEAKLAALPPARVVKLGNTGYIPRAAAKPRPAHDPSTTLIRGNRWARMLALKLHAHGIEGFEREVRFHPTRKWRFDFANAQAMLAVEIEGITKDGGRHQRRQGFIRDIHKYAEALVLGWRVLRVTPGLVLNGVAIDYIKRALTKEGKCSPWPP